MPLSKTWINAIERLASDTGIKVYCDLDDKRHQWNLDGKQKSNCEHHLYTITFSWHKLHDTLFARKQKFVFQFCWGISLLLPLSHWLLFSFTFLHCFVLLNWTQADYLMLHTGMIPNSSKTVWSINKTDTCQNAQLHLLSGTIIDMAKQSATEFAGYDFFWQRRPCLHKSIEYRWECDYSSDKRRGWIQIWEGQKAFNIFYCFHPNSKSHSDRWLWSLYPCTKETEERCKKGALWLKNWFCYHVTNESPFGILFSHDDQCLAFVRALTCLE